MRAPASNFEIRPAVLEDAAGIRALTRAAYAKWVALIGREPLPMQADYERAVAEHTIDLLIVDGALAGLVETILRPDHLWIENVAVAPEQQGRGFGRLLRPCRASRHSCWGPGNPPADQSGVRANSNSTQGVVTS
jgi:GNAT superfamily N-acetyltransferase